RKTAAFCRFRFWAVSITNTSLRGFRHDSPMSSDKLGPSNCGGQVGDDNVFIFGLTASQVNEIKRNYNPWDYYNSNQELDRVIDMIRDGVFSPEQHDLFHPIVDTLIGAGRDYYLLMADYASYVECQEQVSETYANPAQWTKQSILNVANTRKFSSDRTIKQYADEIWGLKAVPVSFAN